MSSESLNLFISSAYFLSLPLRCVVSSCFKAFKNLEVTSNSFLLCSLSSLYLLRYLKLNSVLY